MSSQLIANARALLQTSQAEKALELLAPEVDKQTTNVPYLQIFGETLLENNDVETAYDVLMKACELDPEAAQGTEKFFYLGQIIGGQDGLNSLDIGLNKLSKQVILINEDKGADDPLLVELATLYPSKDDLKLYLVKKLNQGIFAKIEIWMTDLCMEPEAESKCDELIEYSLSLDPENPEALSLLSSIRISQQRNDEAKEALLKSWAKFEEKKTLLEEASNKAKEDGEDAFEVGLEYVELIQPLLTLAKFAIELELYDIAVSISSNITDINEDILEAYYYESLSHLFAAKKAIGVADDSDYRDTPVSAVVAVKTDEVKGLVAEAKSALTQAFRIVNSESCDADQDLVEQVKELIQEVGGPNMSELMPKRVRDDDEWENEIEYE